MQKRNQLFLIVLAIACLMPAARVFADSASQFEAPHCTVRLETNEEWRTIEMRLASHINGEPCALNEEQTAELVASVLSAVTSEWDAKNYTTLRVGRVQNYPWMKRYLEMSASEDPEWMQAEGRPASGHENAYVNAVLSRSAVMDVFNAAAESYGLQFRRMDCEKVFIAENGLPMDAFCWAELAQQ